MSADGTARDGDEAVDPVDPRYDDERRGLALDRLGLLGTGAEERFDRITRLAGEEFGVDLALVNLVGEDSLYAKSQPVGVQFGTTPFGVAFCEHTVRGPGLLEIPDAAADPRWSHLPAVTEHGMRFYAGVPLRVSSGEAVGTLCLYGTEPRTLDDDERALLGRLGRWAQAELRSDDPAGAQEAPVAVVADDPPAPAPADEARPDARVSTLAIPFGEVSGDASAWTRTEQALVVSLVDVMGKGEAAGAVARTVVDGLQALGPVAPARALHEVEAAVGASLRDGDTFTTVFHAVLDLATGVLDYVDAGHGLTMHVTADGGGTRLYSRNLPLGLMSDGGEWEAGRLQVARGDVIVSVSDGALDAYDSTLESLRRLAEELLSARDAGAFFDALAARVADQAVDDDVTTVVIALD